MPSFEAFQEADGYYATLAHEFIHWTRHPTRLDRQRLGRRYGDALYAMEKLVAEFGAAFICADLDLTPEPREEHVSYIAH